MAQSGKVKTLENTAQAWNDQTLRACSLRRIPVQNLFIENESPGAGALFHQFNNLKGIFYKENLFFGIKTD